MKFMEVRSFCSPGDGNYFTLVEIYCTAEKIELFIIRQGLVGVSVNVKVSLVVGPSGSKVHGVRCHKAAIGHHDGTSVQVVPFFIF